MKAGFTLPLSKVFLRTHLSRMRARLVGQKLPSQPKNGPEKTSEKVVFQAGLVGLKPVVLEKPQLVLPKPATKLISTSVKSSFSQVNWLSQIIQTAATLAIIVSTLMLGVLFGPDLYYRFNPSDTTLPLSQAQLQAGNQSPTATQSGVPVYQPPVNPDLPQGRWLVIPRIGLRTQLQETENLDEALNKGVWMVPGYGQPGSTKQPVIVAAHRYGWEWWWKGDYWKYHSFYLLPDLETGDRVEIIDNQRKWVYEVYAGEEGKAISDYQADLIMYTCKFLNSPIRHFRYARLVDPTQNTQSQATTTTK